MKNRCVPWPLRIILFLVLVCLLLNLISGPLIFPYEERVYSTVRGLYEETPGSLDAVFIGNSNTYTFWVPLFAWKEYGITSFDYSVPFQKMESYRYLIEEARKTQPDALYVVSIGNPSIHLAKEHVHVLTDYMHHSFTRTRLIRTYAKYNGFTHKEQLEQLLPLLIHHFRWDELTEGDYSRSVFAKGAQNYRDFLDRIVDLSGRELAVAERAESRDLEMEVISDLLDELDRNQTRVLFLNPPQFHYSDDEYARMKSLLDLIEERGYHVLRAEQIMEEAGLDPAQDFYDPGHTNIHGAAKYTHFVARYLQEHYGFSDKRGDPDYQDFDAAYEEYKPFFAPFVLDFEVKGALRTDSLKAPELLSVERDGQAVKLTWGESPRADGYRVYRKCRIAAENGITETAWEALGDLEGSQLQYIDRTAEEGADYTYTVVPCSIDGEGVLGVRYGDFRYHGISTEDSATTQPGTQEVLSDCIED